MEYHLRSHLKPNISSWCQNAFAPAPPTGEIFDALVLKTRILALDSRTISWETHCDHDSLSNCEVIRPTQWQWFTTVDRKRHLYNQYIHTKLLVASCGQLQFCDAPDFYRTRHVWSQVSGSASGKQRSASAAVKRTSSSLSSRATTTNISKSVPSAPFRGTYHEPLHNMLSRDKG